MSFSLPRFEGEHVCESGERWRLVVGQTEYAVSDGAGANGRLYSYKSNRLMSQFVGSHYYLAKLGGKMRRVHVLIADAFLSGAGFIDHKNGVKTDNRLVNLRRATSSENNVNVKLRTNTTGYSGVSLSRGRFQALIRIAGKNTYLGLFSTAHEAGLAYARKAEELHGEFLAPHVRELLDREELAWMHAEDVRG